MARIRTVKPSFFTSEDVMALSPLARLLYIGTWLEADREGRLAWKPLTLKVRYLPSDACDIHALCAELVGRGLVVPYGSSLAFIPSFKTHQFINPREAKSVFPEPSDDATARVIDASLRVNDAPSLPSYIPSLPNPSLPERKLVQGTGAFVPGSLPRDHQFHVICGPTFRLCLKSWECGELMRIYGGEEPAAKAAVVSFVESLERTMGDGAAGDMKWLKEHFRAWMASIGRLPVAAEKVSTKPAYRGVAAILADQEARKAAAK